MFHFTDDFSNFTSSLNKNSREGRALGWLINRGITLHVD